MPVTCPYGAEMQGGAPNSVVWDEIAAALFQLLGDMEPLPAVITDLFAWMVFSLPEVCANGPYDYPTITSLDWLTPGLLYPKLMAYARAYIWDKWCQCKAAPGG